MLVLVAAESASRSRRRRHSSEVVGTRKEREKETTSSGIVVEGLGRGESAHRMVSKTSESNMCIHSTHRRRRCLGVRRWRRRLFLDAWRRRRYSTAAARGQALDVLYVWRWSRVSSAQRPTERGKRLHCWGTVQSGRLFPRRDIVRRVSDAIVARERESGNEYSRGVGPGTDDSLRDPRHQSGFSSASMVITSPALKPRSSG